MPAQITAPSLAFGALATSTLWNNVYSSLTSDINKHISETDFPHPSLTNATALSNPSTLFKRDANAAGNVGSMSIGGAATIPTVSWIVLDVELRR